MLQATAVCPVSRMHFSIKQEEIQQNNPMYAYSKCERGGGGGGVERKRAFHCNNTLKKFNPKLSKA